MKFHGPDGVADRRRNFEYAGDRVADVADVGFIEKAHEHNAAWLTWTEDKLRGLGLAGPASAGNFVLARFSNEKGKDAEAADAFLKERGVIVRRLAAYGLPDSLRITIGLEKEMRTVIDGLTEFMA